MKKKPKLTGEDARRVKVLRGELTKVRCWLTGFEAGTGKVPPGADALRQIIIFIDEATAE